MEITVKSNAKINYFLNINGIDKKGYHNIDTVMSSIDLGDIINVKINNNKDINLNCKGINKNNNTAYIAAKLFQDKFNTNGFNITIKKQIPFSAGLGGSSADSAGVIFALGKLYSIQDNELKQFCLKCGSDTYFMFKGGFARATGKGEILAPFTCNNNFDIVIAKPEGGINSCDAYKMYDKLNNDKSLYKAEIVITALQNNNLNLLTENCYNALTKPALIILPEIEKVINLINEQNPITAFMSGSGSACVGIFTNQNEANKCADYLNKKGYFAKALKTINKGIEII